MHFIAIDSSFKMMTDLISWVNDFCTLNEICDYLGKRNKDDLESRQDSSSAVLALRVRDTASPCRASAADNLSDHAWTVERTS